MDAAGNVNVDGMIAVLPPDFASKVSGAIKKCGTQGNLFKQNYPKF